MLVNNAGYGYMAALEEGDDAEVRRLFDTNYFGVVDMIKAVLPGMRARATGHIVNISSMTGLVANPPNIYYSSTKFALEALTEGLAKELQPLGIPCARRARRGPYRLGVPVDAGDRAPHRRLRRGRRRAPRVHPVLRRPVARRPGRSPPPW